MEYLQNRIIVRRLKIWLRRSHDGVKTSWVDMPIVVSGHLD